jgi:hypothetical protein
MIPEKKICIRCDIEKELSSFNNMPKSVEKKRNVCKECCLRIARECHKRKVELLGGSVRVFRKGVSVEQKKIENLQACKKYRENNIEKKRKSAREWARRNKKNQLEKWVNRYNTDTLFNLSIKIRRCIWATLNKGHLGKRKGDTTIKLLGCSYDYLKTYIEKKFTEGMTWDKVISGEIHLDHKKPCSSFDLSDEEEQKKCFNYSNLQPMWWYDNLSKSDKIDEKYGNA